MFFLMKIKLFFIYKIFDIIQRRRGEKHEINLG